MANLHAKRVMGNLVYYDRSYQQRWIRGEGVGVTQYIFDPCNFPVDDTTADPTMFTVTTVDGGADAAGFVSSIDGALKIATDDAENDGANVQLKGEAFKMDATTTNTYFGINLQINDATQSDLLVGLCITDTGLLGGMTDGVYFECLDGSTDINFVLEKDSTETTSATAVGTLADATNITLEFFFDGTYVDAWVDGVLQTRLATTNLPNNEYLTPSIHLLTGEAAVQTLTVNWWRVVQVDGTK